MIYVLYFVAGVVRDGLAALYELAIIKRRALSASVLGVFLTLLDLTVLAAIVLDKNWWLAGLYAAGNGVGIYAALRWGDKLWQLTSSLMLRMRNMPVAVAVNFLLLMDATRAWRRLKSSSRTSRLFGKRGGSPSESRAATDALFTTRKSGVRL